MMRSFSWRALIPLLILALTFLIYLPAIHAGFIWDDDDYVINNQTLRSLEGLRQIWMKPGAVPQYYPLVHTTFWLEYQTWGLNPMGYHVINILLHAINAILLGFILQFLSIPGAWLAAALFAVHPVHVESVAWVTERKNVLSGFFYLCSLLTYLRYAFSTAWSQRWLYLVSLGLFVLALLSKTVTCTLPVIILLILWWKNGRIQIQDLYRMAPFFLLGIALGLTTAWLERHHVGATGEAWNFTFIQRILIAGRALWFYTGKLLWPHPLVFIYPRWEINDTFWWQYLFPFGFFYGLFLLWKFLSRLGRGPLVCMLFFSISLFPALGFFDVYPMLFSFVADHFQYLASIGVITLASAGSFRILHWKYAASGSLSAMLAVVLLTVSSFLTWRQSHVYKDAESVWRDTLEKNPKAWLAHNNLAVILDDQKKLDEAIPHYREALRLFPKFPEGHQNLGGILIENGELDKARFHISEAIRLKPDYAEAWYNLGVILDKENKGDEAISAFRESLRLKPGLPSSHYSLALTLARNGKIDEAIETFESAVKLDPQNPQYHYNLALALQKQNQLDRAEKHLIQALNLDPKLADAHFKLADICVLTRKAERAIRHYRESLALNPQKLEAQVNLAWLLSTHPDSRWRNGEEAVKLAEAAYEIMGDEEYAVLETLSAAHAEAGNFEKAILYGEKALNLAEKLARPDFAAHMRERLQLFRSGKSFHASQN